MAALTVQNAEFNRLYTLTLDTLNSGLILNFNRGDQWKRLDQIFLDGVSTATGGWLIAAGDALMIPLIVIKGRLTTLLSPSPPIPQPFPVATQYDGNWINYFNINVAEKTGPINYDPSLLIEPDQGLCVAVWRPYQQSDGTQENATIALTVMGQYLPKKNANLTKEAYLNAPSAA